MQEDEGPLRLAHQSSCDCRNTHKDDEELEDQGVAAIWFDLVNRHKQYGGNDADAEDVNESQQAPLRLTVVCSMRRDPAGPGSLNIWRMGCGTCCYSCRPSLAGAALIRCLSMAEGLNTTTRRGEIGAS
jgi:hypothetical protein